VAADAADPLNAVLTRLGRSPDDPEAWRQLHDQIKPYVCRILARHMPQMPNAIEDGFQDVFVRLIHHCRFERVRDAAGFCSYLRRICRSVATDYDRRQGRKLKSHPLDDADAVGQQTQEPAPESAAIVEELLTQIFSGLQPPDRKLLRLLLKGHSQHQIELATGLRYQAVASRIHRLRTRILKYLQSKDL